MKHAYVRNGIVEFIEERGPISVYYPETLWKSLVPLDPEQEKVVCKGWRYDGKTFSEPELMAPIPNVGGYYIPNDKDKMAQYVIHHTETLEQRITDLELDNIEANQKLAERG